MDPVYTVFSLVRTLRSLKQCTLRRCGTTTVPELVERQPIYTIHVNVVPVKDIETQVLEFDEFDVLNCVPLPHS